MLSKPQNEPDGSRTARWESGSLASVLLTLAEALGKKSVSVGRERGSRAISCARVARSPAAISGQLCCRTWSTQHTLSDSSFFGLDAIDASEMSKGFDYSKFDKIGDSDESSDDEDWKLTDAERKAKREKKREELIEKELASHKAIEEKLKRAEKLPPRRSDDDGPTPEAPAAWSDGRRRDEKDPAKLRERVAAIDGVLGQLADDADFQADLKRPTVQKAIDHWTNRARLKGPEAQELFGDASPEAPRLRSVLAKISRLSAACKAAGMPVPIDRVLAGRRVAFDPPAPKKKEAPALDEYGLPPLPPPTPFSWRRFLRQLAVQMSCLLVSLVIVKTWIEPRLLRQLDERMAAERAELDPASEVVYSEEEEWAAEPDLL